MHVKTAHKTVDVPTEAPPQQQQPTPGPLYEEVAPAKEEIEIKHMDQLDNGYNYILCMCTSYINLVKCFVAADHLELVS